MPARPTSTRRPTDPRSRRLRDHDLVGDHHRLRHGAAELTRDRRHGGTRRAARAGRCAGGGHATGHDMAPFAPRTLVAALGLPLAAVLTRPALAADSPRRGSRLGGARRHEARREVAEDLLGLPDFQRDGLFGNRRAAGEADADGQHHATGQQAGQAAMSTDRHRMPSSSATGTIPCRIAAPVDRSVAAPRATGAEGLATLPHGRGAATRETRLAPENGAAAGKMCRS